MSSFLLLACTYDMQHPVIGCRSVENLLAAVVLEFYAACESILGSRPPSSRIVSFAD